MTQQINSASICNLSLCIVGYAVMRISTQNRVKQHFNALIDEAIIQTLAQHDRIMLHTVDGATISLLAEPEEALFLSTRIRDGVLQHNLQADEPMALRIGISLDPATELDDIHGHPNMIGDGVDVAESVMNFAEANQILVSPSFYEAASSQSPRMNREINGLFSYAGSMAPGTESSVSTPVVTRPAAIGEKTRASKTVKQITKQAREANLKLDGSVKADMTPEENTVKSKVINAKVIKPKSSKPRTIKPKSSKPKPGKPRVRATQPRRLIGAVNPVNEFSSFVTPESAFRTKLSFGWTVLMLGFLALGLSAAALYWNATAIPEINNRPPAVSMPVATTPPAKPVNLPAATDPIEWEPAPHNSATITEPAESGQKAPAINNTKPGKVASNLDARQVRPEKDSVLDRLRQSISEGGGKIKCTQVEKTLNQCR